MCHGSHMCLCGQIGSCGGIIRGNVGHLSIVSAAGPCQRKWIFPACPSSVVWHGISARCLGIDAMCHGLRVCLDGQVGICDGGCCNVGVFSPISHL